VDPSETNIPAAPTRLTARITALDVLRGFAVLGILTMNIIAMGMASPAYFNPLIGKGGGAASILDQRIWLVADMTCEGAFRTLFSMLFGAGIVLFTTGDRAKSGRLHYKRQFWLLIIGLVDAYLLLWHGDILVVYAICGAILYWFRNFSARWLFVFATLLLCANCMVHLASVAGLQAAQEISDTVRTADINNEDVSADDREIAEVWREFEQELLPTADGLAVELDERTSGFRAAYQHAAVQFTEQLLSVMSMFMVWDALLMMLLGMALFKSNVMDGSYSSYFYVCMMLVGFIAGLAVNTYEAWWSYTSNYSLVSTFLFIQPTYDLGRLGMGFGYLGLILWWCRTSWWTVARTRLAAVGRMALTNYLMHSAFALLLFSGAGLGLAGELSRAQVYLVMLAIWVFQLWFSPWWLARNDFGPIELIWRRLTYGWRGA